MRISRHPWLIAAAIALAALAAPRPARAQLGMGQTDPPLSTANLKSIEKLLDMTPDQRSSADLVYMGSMDAYKLLTDQFNTQMAHLSETDRDTGWNKDKIQRLFALQREFAIKRETVQTRLMADLKSMLTLQQAERWPAAEHMMRRELLESLGHDAPCETRWTGVDLFKMVDEAKPTDAERAALAPVLEAYESALDAAIVDMQSSFKRIIAMDMSELQEAFMAGNIAKVQPAWDDITRSTAHLRSVNRTYSKQVEAQLGEAAAAAFDKKLHRLVYSHVYERTSQRPSLPRLAAIEKLDDLTDAQRATIDEIKSRYERDSASADRQAEASLERFDEEITLTKMMEFEHAPGGMDSAWKEMRDTRSALETRTLDALNAALTPEQRDKLAAKPNEPQPPTPVPE